MVRIDTKEVTAAGPRARFTQAPQDHEKVSIDPGPMEAPSHRHHTVTNSPRERIVAGALASTGVVNLDIANHHTFHIFNTIFAKAETDILLSDIWTLGLKLQYTDQRDVDDACIGDFSTGLIAGKLELETETGTLRVALSETGDGK